MSIAWPPLLTSVLMLAAVALMLAAALHDVAARTVPNGLACVLALAGLALRVLDGSLPSGLGAGGAVFFLAVVCWRLGCMGGGDVKLLGAAALVVPPGLALMFITAVAICGGILALLYLAARRIVPPPSLPRPRTLLARVLRAESWRIHRGGPLPYACAIAAGGLFILL